MGGFLSSLGSGIASYAENRAARSPLGRAIAGGMRYRHQPQQVNPWANGTDKVAGYPTQQSDESGMDDSSLMPTPLSEDPSIAPSPASQGTLVTKPTVVLLGEKEPEMVVPLNGNPYNKTSMPGRYRGGGYGS